MKKLKYQILFTILFITIGIAAVTSNLVINGNTSIASNPDDFLVYFSDVKLNGVQDLSLVNNETSLVFNKEFSAVNQTVTISYDVTNASKNYDADVDITCTQSTNYLTITNSFDTTNNLGARQTKTGTLTITQSKSYTGTSLTQDIYCTITSSAIERTAQNTTTIPDGVKGYYPTLMARPKDEDYAFWTNEYRNRITEIRFEDEINIPSDAIESWDISTTQDGSIMAYVVDNDDYYCDQAWEAQTDALDLVIQADNRMYANPDMSYWFANFGTLKTIQNLEKLDTISTINMSYMFYINQEQTPERWIVIDLRELNTSKVTDMSYMFYGISTEVGDISIYMNGMDISNVQSMSYMFAGIWSATGNTMISLANTQTNNVTDMSYMLSSIGTISGYIDVNLNGFDTSKVRNMSHMFAYSSGIYTTLTVSNPQVNDYSEMFVNTNWPTFNDIDGDIIDGDIIINYTDSTEHLVDLMLETKASESGVRKGILVTS